MTATQSVTPLDLDTYALLRELESLATSEVNRHFSMAKTWYPHDYVPWSQGRDFDGLYEGQAWSIEQSTINEDARAALIVNLLTEDNLPSYHAEILRLFGPDGAWGTWVHRWTAEEGRHATVIRDYLIVTRAVDPVALEDERMNAMSTGFASDYGDSAIHALAYVSFQELATRISHRNTGTASGDAGLERLLSRVAADENLHMLFYRNVLAGALEVAPNETMRAITDVVTTFQMPGHMISGFTRASVKIADAGIYDLRLHKDQVLLPVLRQWKVWDLEGLNADGERARDELDAYLAKLETAASRFEERREARRARKAG